MTDYVYLDDEEILKDNILDSKCKIVHLKRRTQGYLYILCVVSSQMNSHWEKIGRN